MDFAPKHVIVPSATGFPPTKVAPGAVGDKRYSPLVTTIWSDAAINAGKHVELTSAAQVAAR